MDHPSGEGSHWVLLDLTDKDCGKYYDSFGLPAPEQVVRYMKKYRKQSVRNIGQHQCITSSSCGWFCIAIENELLKGRSFVDTIAMFDTRGDLRQNDEKLKRYFGYKK